MVNPKTKSLEEEIMKAQNAKVDYIAFSGGGAKGAAYSGVYEALAESGIMKNVKAVAGASAGAMTAAVIATGITAAEFEKISKETNLKDLLGKEGALMINKDGTPLYELVKKTIQSNVLNYLNNVDISKVCVNRLEQIKLEQIEIVERLKPHMKHQNTTLEKIANLSLEMKLEINSDAQKLIQQQIDLLKNQEIEIQDTIKAFKQQDLDLQNQTKKIQTIMDNGEAEFKQLREKASNGGAIYFKDLGLLNLVNPERFKDLVMTATRRDNAETTIFSPEATPNVEIALAVRASASIPLVFQPVTIDGIQYVDGGYRDNTPIHHFNKKHNKDDNAQDITGDLEKVKEAKQQDRTLAFAFGSNQPDDSLHLAVYSAKKKIHSPNIVVKFLMDVVYKMAAKIGGDFKYSKSEEENYQKIRNNALNMIMVDTKSVSTLSFDEAQKKANYLHIKGYMQTVEHMHNHELGIQTSKNLDHMVFMLEIFEKVDANVKSSWSSRVNVGREVKAEALLEFCKPDQWKENSKEELIEKYIILAATNYKEKKLSENTSTINKLIDTLNNPKTPNSIKSDYAKILNVNIEKTNDIGKLKFSKNDFKDILVRNKDNISLNKGLERT